MMAKWNLQRQCVKSASIPKLLWLCRQDHVHPKQRSAFLPLMETNVSPVFTPAWKLSRHCLWQNAAWYLTKRLWVALGIYMHASLRECCSGQKEVIFSNSLCLLKSYGNAKKMDMPHSCLTLAWPAQCAAPAVSYIGLLSSAAPANEANDQALASTTSHRAKVGWNCEIRESCHNFVTEFLL